MTDFRERKSTVRGLEDLRRLYKAASVDGSEVLDPDPVFDALEMKYNTFAEESGR
jgi:hypothetical protein